MTVYTSDSNSGELQSVELNESSKITIISTHIGHVRGGAEINDLTISSELQKLGHNVSFITIEGEKANLIEYPTINITCPYVYDWSYSLPGPTGKLVRHMNEELFIYRTRHKASQRLRESDIVYATGRPILVRLQTLTEASFIHTVRGRVNPLYHRYLKQADGLVFWGGCEQEYDNKSIFSVPHRKIDPGTNPKLFHPRQLNPTMIPEYADNDRTVLIFSGRLEPVKRVENIIDAIACIEDTFDISLVILGDGSLRSELETRAESELDKTLVHFLGHVDHNKVPIHLNAADVFVMSSEIENHPIALKEALSCGTYAVAPSIGRIPDIVTKRSGYVYHENTVSGLKTTLRTVLNQDLHQQGSRRKRAEVVADWSDATTKLLSLFSELR